MKRETPAIRMFRWAVVGLGLLLPILTLVPLGSLWLWQNGWLVPWALGACVTTLAAWVAQRWLLGPTSNRAATDPGPAEPVDTATSDTTGDPGWTPAETAAWAQVQSIAAVAEPNSLASRDAALSLALRTVDAVARSLHRDTKQPLYQFTAPEALALIERVAARMRYFLVDHVPLGDRLTIAQVMAVWRQRGLLDTAEKAYDVWRAIRLINPATAIATEMREQIQKELLAWGKQHVVKRLVIVYVEEVGRAAIDLYGGRLRVLPAKLARHVTAQSARDLKAAAGDAIQAEPLRILVAGQIGAGKSSLVNALADEMRAAVDALPATDGFTPYRLEREGLPAALIFDSPGLASDPAQRRALIERASAADLLIWVCAANRADRAADAQALAELRAHFAERPNRRRPPMLLVLSHADRLRPFQDWHPPYDLNDRQSAKAASMRAAVEACAADLGFPAEQAIPSCLDISVGLYNIDAVWAGLMALLPDAQQARLVRTLREADGAWDWRRIWLQARNGGRVLAGAALR